MDLFAGQSDTETTRTHDAPLSCLGIGQCAEMVYKAMIRNHEWSVTELARELGLSEEEIRLGLDELAATSLVRPSWEDPGMFNVVKPSVAIGALISAEQQDILERQRRLENGRAAMADLMADFERGQADSQGGGHVEFLNGVDSVRLFLEEISREATSEVLALIPRASLTSESMEASKELDEKIVERGVAIRTIYLDSVRNHPATRRYAAWLNGCGGEVRTAPLLPMRIILVDQKVALLPIDVFESGRGALVVRQPTIIAALLALFARLWDEARPLGTAEQPDDQGLSPQERELLRLLASGMTDEAAGKQLAISVRSVRRLMSDIMARLEARSRFEAGVRASERGWL
ncbi:helix-turn-helix transcriptional regulator [Streptomyces sp. H27-H1]|uniref:helix-turn-helix domain-containing protein n=1 Tax=Streptomyces sp. H27-H1 TaxID=2996461 RepID=UPI00226F3C34|nr:helix-turn-helix transcriptional regulator [Streptomyces sp. H27-H1]MCY0924889.1 helix-turn-helix transcriptional regulator [Streptomyces sp. H27-H1]